VLREQMVGFAAQEGQHSYQHQRANAWLDGTPPPNVWVGTTGEDQRRYGDAMSQQGFQYQQAIQGRSDAVADANFGQQGAIYDAQDNARLRELQTQLALRNQPINEITALMSGSQVQTPNFGIAQPSHIPTTDYAGIQQQGFANQMANYQTQNSNYQALMGGLFGLGRAGIMAGG